MSGSDLELLAAAAAAAAAAAFSCSMPIICIVMQVLIYVILCLFSLTVYAADKTLGSPSQVTDQSWSSHKIDEAFVYATAVADHTCTYFESLSMPL